MKLLDLVTTLTAMHSKHGNLEVMVESMTLTNIEFVHAIEGEFSSYIDLCSQE